MNDRPRETPEEFRRRIMDRARASIQHGTLTPVPHSLVAPIHVSTPPSGPPPYPRSTSPNNRRAFTRANPASTPTAPVVPSMNNFGFGVPPQPSYSRTASREDPQRTPSQHARNAPLTRPTDRASVTSEQRAARRARDTGVRRGELAQEEEMDQQRLREEAERKWIEEGQLREQEIRERRDFVETIKRAEPLMRDPIQQAAEEEERIWEEDRRRREEFFKLEEKRQKERQEEEARRQSLQKAITYYESTWTVLKAKREGQAGRLLTFTEFPWPSLRPVFIDSGLTCGAVEEFVRMRSHYQNKSEKEVVRGDLLKWHPDKLNDTLLTLWVREDAREYVKKTALHVGRWLTGLNEER